MTTYLAIRCDCEDATHAPLMVARLRTVLDKAGVIVRGTYGHEVSLKAKKGHFHWHVELHHDKPLNKAFSAWVKREYDKLVVDELLLSPEQVSCSHPVPQPLHLYAIKVLEQVDPNRWFRYPFKDLSTIDSSLQTGFTLEDQSLMLCAAKTEREIAKKTFEKHENKLNNDKQSRKLLWEWLDAELPHLKLHSDDLFSNEASPMHEIGTKIVEYNIKYNDYKIPMDLKRRTIMYMASKGLHPGHIARILM